VEVEVDDVRSSAKIADRSTGDTMGMQVHADDDEEEEVVDEEVVLLLPSPPCADDVAINISLNALLSTIDICTPLTATSALPSPDRDWRYAEGMDDVRGRRGCDCDVFALRMEDEREGVEVEVEEVEGDVCEIIERFVETDEQHNSTNSPSELNSSRGIAIVGQ
jgi:hypothetical protein